MATSSKIMGRRLFLGSLFTMVDHIRDDRGGGSARQGRWWEGRYDHPLTALYARRRIFTAPPHRVYEALLDEKQFSGFTGAPAKITRTEGGTLSLFGGAITARNIELVPDKRIVQAWRDPAWGPGIHSIVKFELTPKGTGTHLVLDHTGFPAGQFSDLDSGWHEHYLEPMKKFLR